MTPIGPVLMLVACLALAGCGGGSGDAGPGAATPTPAVARTASTPQPVATPTATPTPVTLVAAGCGPTGITGFDPCPPGVVARSDDGGRTWSTSRVGEVLFNDLDFIDARRGWATATTDLLETDDGGLTWQSRRDRLPQLTTGSHQHAVFAALEFADEERGIVVGWVGSIGFQISAFVLTTDDGGGSWRIAFTQQNATLMDVCLTRAGIGLASGEGLTVLSSDQGASWTAAADSVPVVEGGSVACSGERDLWSVGSYPSLVHSADGGVTWQDETARLPFEAGNNLPARIVFTGDLLGAIAWSAGAIAATEDGGETWTLRTIVDAQVPFDFATFVDAEHAVALTLSAAALSDDGARSWEVVPITPREFTRFHAFAVAR